MSPKFFLTSLIESRNFEQCPPDTKRSKKCHPEIVLILVSPGTNVF